MIMEEEVEVDEIVDSYQEYRFSSPFVLVHINFLVEGLLGTVSSVTNLWVHFTWWNPRPSIVIL